MSVSTAPLRLAIVNDYQVVVAGLAAVLSSHASRVRVVELDSRMLSISDVDIVLLDTFAFASDGFIDLGEMVRHAQRNGARVVVYSWVTDTESIQRCLSEGARGHLWKGLTAVELVDAVEAVRAGQVVTRGAANSLPAHPERLGPEASRWPGRDLGLSDREAEVVALIAKGMNNPEIAEELYLGINTIKTYIRTAYRKMGVSSRTQAVLWAIDHGFDLEARRTLLDAGTDDARHPPMPHGGPAASSGVAAATTATTATATPQVVAVEAAGDTANAAADAADHADQLRGLVPALVGLTMVGVDGVKLFTVAASSVVAAGLDAVQHLTGGPCPIAAASRQVVICNRKDLDARPSWRVFALATTHAGVQSTMCVPVRLNGRSVGIINLYADTVDAFVDRREAIARELDTWAPQVISGAVLPARRPRVQTETQHLRADLDIRTAAHRIAALSAIPHREARRRLDDAAHRAGITKTQLARSLLGAPALRATTPTAFAPDE